MEKMWFEDKNKLLQNKRLDEETKQVLNDWSETRSRMESEISRRKEHMVSATNFAKVRGFVRSCWKTKNYNPGQDPCAWDSSTDESDEDDINFRAMKKKQLEGGEVPENIDEVDGESQDENSENDYNGGIDQEDNQAM